MPHSPFASLTPARLALRAAFGRLPGRFPPARVRIPHFEFPIPHTPPRLRASAGNPSPIRPQSSVLGRFAAFTLIELLVVIAVISILAGLVLAAMSGVQNKSAIDRTRAEIAAISNALEQFRNIHDIYPATVGSNLVPTNIAPFFETRNSQTNDAGHLVDPYGNPYQYLLPGTRNPATFDIWSRGRDTTTSADDIGNW